MKIVDPLAAVGCDSSFRHVTIPAISCVTHDSYVFCEQAIKHLVISTYLSLSHRFFMWLAFVAVAVFALLGLSYDDLGRKCLQVASLIGWLDLLLGRRHVLRSFPFYLLWAALLVQLGSWWLSFNQVPEMAESSPKLHRLGVWFQFLPIAWILAGSYWRVAVIMVCSGLGLCLAPWLSGGGWHEIQQGIAGERVDFGLSNAQHTSLYYACALLAVLTIGRYLHRANDWRRWLGWGLRVVLGGVFLAGVLLSQTRGIWLGLVVAVVLIGFWFLMHSQFVGTASRRLLYGFTLCAMLLILLISLSESRFAARLYTSIEQISSATVDVNGLARSQDQSAALRVHLWHEGIEWIEERPLLGWGGAGRKYASQAAELPPQFHEIQHLHSSFVDTLVCYGIAGLVIFLLWMIWFVGAARQASHSGDLPQAWYRLALAWMALWVVANLFESYMFFASGTYLIAVIGGCLVSLIWRAQGRLH